MGYQHLLDTAIESGATPGITAAVVSGAETVFMGAAGTRDANGGAAMAVDDMFVLYSMTKPLVSVAAMMLVEQQRVDLTTPANELVPEIGAAGVLTGFDGDGQPVTRPPQQPVTLHHLLTHTSGYVYDMWSPELLQWGKATGWPNVATHQRKAFEAPLAFDPGDRWQYGIGIDWAGLVIEAVANKPLGDVLAELLFDPLGMSDTGFERTLDQMSRSAALHSRTSDGFQSMGVRVPKGDIQSGGGGLSSTIVDYTKFLTFMLGDGTVGGQRLLAPETMTQIVTNQLGDLSVQPLVSANKALTHDVDMFPGEPKGWSYGFQVNLSDIDGRRRNGTLSWAGLANLYFWVDRQAQKAGAVMNQFFPFADPQALDTFSAIETLAYR